MAVVVRDEPVEDVLALDLSDLVRRQFADIKTGEVIFAGKIGSPSLDRSGATVELDCPDLDAVRVDKATYLVCCLFAVRYEVISGCRDRLEEPLVTFLVDPELLFVAPPTLALPSYLNLLGLPCSVHEASTPSNSDPFLVNVFGVADVTGSGATCDLG